MKTVNSKLKIVVVAGGIGTERQVSIQSGDCVAAALKTAGADVSCGDITPDNLEILDYDETDIFFIALHGTFGEDGRLQKILEERDLCYTGSRSAASMLAMDKMLSKKVFGWSGVNVPKAIEFTGDQDIEPFGSITDKYVVKPIRQGSSVGVNIVQGWQQVAETGKMVLAEYGDCMIEEFVKGRELAVGIVSDQVLPIIEIRPANEFYDYNAKYEDQRTEFLFDTIADSRLASRIRSAAMDCFRAVGGEGFGRVDFILAEDGKSYVLEVNTIPGLTTHSLLPKAAKKDGLSMSELCVRIVNSAVKKLKVKS